MANDKAPPRINNAQAGQRPTAVNKLFFLLFIGVSDVGEVSDCAFPGHHRHGPHVLISIDAGTRGKILKKKDLFLDPKREKAFKSSSMV